MHGVAFLFQFFYGAATGLLEDAIDDRLPDLGGQFSDRPEIFPPGRDRAGAVVHKMLNAAFDRHRGEIADWVPLGPNAIQVPSTLQYRHLRHNRSKTFEVYLDAITHIRAEHALLGAHLR
jgi:hypothetical protein